MPENELKEGYIVGRFEDHGKGIAVGFRFTEKDGGIENIQLAPNTLADADVATIKDEILKRVLAGEKGRLISSDLSMSAGGITKIVIEKSISPNGKETIIENQGSPGNTTKRGESTAI